MPMSGKHKSLFPVWTKVFLLTWSAYVLYYFCRKNFSIAMPLLSQEKGWSNYDFAWEITVYSLLYMSGQFLSGISADRFGARLTMLLGMIMIISANMMMGLAGSVWVFAFLMGLNGLGQSTGWSGSLKLLTLHTRAQNRGVLMSWWTTSYVAGGFLAVIFATWWAVNDSVLAGLSWRRIFWAPVVLMTAFIPFFHAGLLRGGVIDRVTNKKKGSILPKWRITLPVVLSGSALWIAAFIYFTIKLIRYTFLFWLPLYLSQSHQYGHAEAGYTSSVFELAGFAGILTAGYASDRLFGGRRFPVTAIMMITMALVFLVHSRVSSWDNWSMITLLAFSGFLIYGPDSLISGATAMDIGDKDHAGLAAGLINGVGSAGQLLSPFLTAYITERYGWNALFSLFCILAIASAILLIFRWNFLPKNQMKLAVT
jgi:sugar phosphate permease